MVERGTRPARAGAAPRGRRRDSGRRRTSAICGDMRMIVARQGDANMAGVDGEAGRSAGLTLAAVHGGLPRLARGTRGLRCRG